MSEYEDIKAFLIKPGDINWENRNLNISPNTYSDSSEGVTLNRWYLDYVPPMTGQITAGGVGATTLTDHCLTNCLYLSLYNTMVDVTRDVLNGNVNYASQASTGYGLITTLTVTGITVPASIVGSLPAQADIQGIVFAANTSGPSTIKVQFTNTSAADSSAVQFASNLATIALLGSPSGTRTLSDIVTLINHPGTCTGACPPITAFLDAAAVGATPGAASDLMRSARWKYRLEASQSPPALPSLGRPS